MVLFVTRVIHSDSERRSTAEAVEKRIIDFCKAQGGSVESQGEILDMRGIDPAALTGLRIISLEERGEDGVRLRINAEEGDLNAWSLDGTIFDSIDPDSDSSIILKSISLFYDNARGVESLNIEIWYPESQTVKYLPHDYVQRAGGGGCSACLLV